MLLNFFIDFDETLYSHKSCRIPQSAMRTLWNLKKRGHRVFLASGRNFYHNLSEAFGSDSFIPDGTINANGGLVVVGEKIIHQQTFDPDLQHAIISYAIQKHYCLMYSYEGVWYTTDYKHCLKSAPQEVNTVLKGFSEFMTYSSIPQYCFFLNDSKEAISDMEFAFPQLNFLRMNDDLGGADIIPSNSGKAHGIEYILQYFGDSWNSVVAIGDSMNDYDMICRAGFGIAMGNALDTLKKAADYTTSDINENGIENAIKYIKAKLGQPKNGTSPPQETLL